MRTQALRVGEMGGQDQESFNEGEDEGGDDDNRNDAHGAFGRELYDFGASLATEHSVEFARYRNNAGAGS